MSTNLYITSDAALLELQIDTLTQNELIHIHNDDLNPSNIIFLALPNNQSVIKWVAQTILSEPNSSLVILVTQDVEIQDVNFENFDHVWITDNKIIK